jgi:hypothetical protein
MGSHGGVYYSTNASSSTGVQWTPSQGIVNLAVRGIANTPLDPSRLWMATFGSGTWTRPSSTAPWSRIPATAIPSDYALAAIPDLYTAGRVFVATWPTLYQSSDGVTYTATSIQSNAFGVAFDPSNSKTVYVATQVSGVFKSTDGGMTWAPSNGNLMPWMTAAGSFIDVRSIVVDPNNSKTVYIGTNGQGVYKSIDGGGSWNNVLAPSGTIDCLMLTGGTSASLYACVHSVGLQQSVNGGTTWTDATSGLPTLDLTGIVLDAPTGDLYAVCGQGVFVKHGSSVWAPFDLTCLPGPSADAPSIVTDGSARRLVVAAAGSVYAHPL